MVDDLKEIPKRYPNVEYVGSLKVLVLRGILQEAQDR